MLSEINLDIVNAKQPSARVLEFANEGLMRAKKIDCFDFVPSDVVHVWQVLRSLPRGRFCEWGSGIGLVTGMARMLGFDACGIELNEELAEASRQLLADYEIDCEIITGSYFDIEVTAEYYFVYCWPGKMNQVEQHFENTAGAGARLLICHGAEDVRCKLRADSGLNTR